MKTIYCLSGLGSDERLFGNLKLDRARVCPVPWLKPLARESTAAYAARLAGRIDSAQPFYLLGVSFGGMLAIEMAPLIRPRRLILVSSVRSRNELPWYGRLVGALHIHRLAPLSLFRYSSPLAPFFVGDGSQAERDFMARFRGDIDRSLLKWSIDRALRWRPGGTAVAAVHIHGTADRILPARYVRPDHYIEGGTHLMIVNRAAEIGALVDRLIAEDEN